MLSDERVCEAEDALYARAFADGHKAGQEDMRERAAVACDAEPRGVHPAFLSEAIRDLEIKEPKCTQSKR